MKIEEVSLLQERLCVCCLWCCNLSLLVQHYRLVQRWPRSWLYGHHFHEYSRICWICILKGVEADMCDVAFIISMQDNLLAHVYPERLRGCRYAGPNIGLIVDTNPYKLVPEYWQLRNGLYFGLNGCRGWSDGDGREGVRGWRGEWPGVDGNGRYSLRGSCGSYGHEEQDNGGYYLHLGLLNCLSIVVTGVSRQTGLMPSARFSEVPLSLAPLF